MYTYRRNYILQILFHNIHTLEFLVVFMYCVVYIAPNYLL